MQIEINPTGDGRQARALLRRICRKLELPELRYKFDGCELDAEIEKIRKLTLAITPESNLSSRKKLMDALSFLQIISENLEKARSVHNVEVVTLSEDAVKAKASALGITI